jgi:hypothetical protein
MIRRKPVNYLFSSLSVVIFFLSLAGEVGAQFRDHPSHPGVTDTISPGKYSTEAGWGILSITKTAARATAFEIQSTTGEDVCHIQGAVTNGEGVATDSENGAVCKIKFTKTGKGINVVSDTPKECGGFCGANGGFKGIYLVVPEGCSADEIDKTRSKFKSLYLKKDYKAALITLQPVLNNCTQILNFVDLGNVRNDIAIVQYKNGLYGECLNTLKPYAIDAKRNDAEVTGDWPPNQIGDYLKIVHASRTNIRLCAK